jgi:AraC-like DNA-binding protein
MMESPESQLAYLGFQLALPSPALRPYVRSYWYFRRKTPLAAYHWEYMHPAGGYGMVFNLGDPLRLDAQAVVEPVFLDGANTVSRKMGFSGRVEVMGIRFREGGAYPILGVPLNELRNEATLLDAVDGHSLLGLPARLGATASLPHRIRLLEEWLAGRLSLGHERHAIIPASLAMLQGSGRHRAIPALARELAISQRQLERLYQTQVGMSPKQYGRLVRVEKARLALKGLNGQTATRLGADLGYYDQSHFIRDFRAVTGMSPSAYRRRKHR